MACPENTVKCVLLVSLDEFSLSVVQGRTIIDMGVDSLQPAPWSSLSVIKSFSSSWFEQLMFRLSIISACIDSISFSFLIKLEAYEFIPSNFSIKSETYLSHSCGECVVARSFFLL